jgi:phage terminase large subunit-like protein
MSQQEDLFAKLQRLPSDEQLAILQALEEKRKKKTFIKYFEPWSEQIEALRQFTADKKVFGLLGGNRSGKSVLGAFIAVAWALGKDYFKDEPAWEYIKDLPIPPAPNNIWIVGLDYNVLRDVLWHEKLRWGKNHPPFLPDDGSIRKVSDGDFQVLFENGSIITGKSADAGREKFQGASVDLVWIDEECEEDVYDECYMRTSDCAGKILLTLTPLTDIHSTVRTPWVFDMYEDWCHGHKDYVFRQLSTINSPFVPAEEKQRLLDRYAGDPEEGARLYGEFVRKSGLVYHAWNPAIHVVKPFDIPKWWQRIVSIDPAATGITAALWLAVDEIGNYYAYREYYERERTVSEHCKAIKMVCGGEPIDYWLLDPYWGGQRNNETHKTGETLYRENGIPVRLPKFADEYPMAISQEFITATVTPNSRHPYLKIFAGLTNFDFEMAHYVWDVIAKGENKGQSREKPRKKNDHLMNAMQYALTLRLKGSRKRHYDTNIVGDSERPTAEQRVKLVSYT